MEGQVRLPTLAPIARQSIADQVFARLYQQVLSLEILPGAKLSKVEVARQFNV